MKSSQASLGNQNLEPLVEWFINQALVRRRSSLTKGAERTNELSKCFECYVFIVIMNTEWIQWLN